LFEEELNKLLAATALPQQLELKQAARVLQDLVFQNALQNSSHCQPTKYCWLTNVSQHKRLSLSPLQPINRKQSCKNRTHRIRPHSNRAHRNRAHKKQSRDQALSVAVIEEPTVVATETTASAQDEAYAASIEQRVQAINPDPAMTMEVNWTRDPRWQGVERVYRVLM
jgi:hypothetical protein